MKCELRKNFGDKRQHKKSPFRGFFYFFYCPGEDLLANLSYSKCDLRISPFPSRFAVKAAFRLASSPENKKQKSSMKEHLNSRNPKRGLNRRNEWISFRVAMVKVLSFLCLCKKALAFMVPRRGLVPLVRYAHCRRRLGTDIPAGISSSKARPLFKSSLTGTSRKIKTLFEGFDFSGAQERTWTSMPCGDGF